MRYDSPWALLVLLVVPVAACFMLRRRGRARARFSSLDWAAGLPLGWRVRLRGLLVLLRVACLVLLTVALMRPREGSRQQRVHTRGVVMQLVVDRSGSMQQPMAYDGRAMSRLDVVKRVLQDFVQGGEGLPGRENDLVGLITFARYADTLCPLVYAHDALLGFLAETETAQTREEDGTAIGDALALAVARLETAAQDIQRRNVALTDSDETTRPDFEIESKVIVLLTDGLDNVSTQPPRDVAAWAKEKGIKIYAIGIGGGAAAMTIQGLFGPLQVPTGPSLDEGLLRSLAEGTGGFYARADDGEALKTVCEQIDALEKTEIEAVEYASYEERFGPWAAAALAVLALEVLLGSTWLRKIP